MPMGDAAYDEPEPRRRWFEGDLPRTPDLDDWLFEAPAQTLSHAVESISSELQRTADSLGQLRRLLDDVARVEPVQVWRRPSDFGLGSVLAEDTLLFDCEGDAPLSVAPSELDGEASFLFEVTGTLKTWRSTGTEHGSAHAA